MKKKTPLSAYRAACKTKASREALVAAIVALCVQHDLKHEVEDWAEISPSEVSVRFVVGHYACSVTFDGSLPVDEFTGDWHMDHAQDIENLPRYPANFGRVIGGSLNDTTFGKATSVSDTFEGLVARLDHGIALLKLILRRHDAAATSATAA